MCLDQAELIFILSVTLALFFYHDAGTTYQIRKIIGTIYVVALISLDWPDITELNNVMLDYI